MHIVNLPQRGDVAKSATRYSQGTLVWPCMRNNSVDRFDALVLKVSHPPPRGNPVVAEYHARSSSGHAKELVVCFAASPYP